MLKSNLLKQIGFIAMMLFSTSLFAQYVIYEDGDINSENAIQNIFNKADYTEVSNSDGRKTYIKNQLNKPQNPTAIRTTEEEYTLTVHLTFGVAEFSAPFGIVIYNDLGDYNYVLYDSQLGGASVELAPGIYDIEADFQNTATGSKHTVIREMVEVEDDTVVEIDVVEAINLVAIEFHDQSGEVLQPGTPNGDNTQISLVFISRMVYFAPGNISPSGGSFWSTQYDPENPAFNFYINDVSDRYSLAHSGVGLYFEEGNYFTKFETITGISGDVVIHNNQDDWVYHNEKFQPSLLGVASGDGYPSVATERFFNGKHFGGSLSVVSCCPVDLDQGFKLWLNNPQNGNPFDILVYNSLIEFSGILDPIKGQQKVNLHGNILMSTQDGGVLYGSGSIPTYNLYLGNNYLIDETGNTQLLNIHSRFSFLAEESTDMIVGNNVPISITAYRPGRLLTKYMGRYGEVRESDYFDTEIEVIKNGNLVFSGGYIDFLSQSNLLNTGLINVNYTNTNIQVDGLASKNTVSLTFNATPYDAPPTLQRLQFRDADNNVTDRFETGAAGRIRIAAGDFQFIPIGAYGGSFNYVEGNKVEVYYSLYDQNNWSELELTEYPEYFQVGYGDYYEASLETVQVAQANSWFDVRIKCTDAAGNTQDQVISPAFKIEDITVAVDKISGNPDFKVFPNPFTDQLTLSLPANVTGDFTLRITDILGKTIYTENKSMSSSNNLVVQGAALAKGVYFLTVETQVELMVKKIVKR